MEQQTYKLYIGRLENMPDKAEFSYYSAESKYLLVYSNAAVDGMSEVPLVNHGKLTERERKWLLGCKTTVNLRAMKENQKEYSKLLDSLVDEFEKELKAESEKNKKK